MINKISVIEVTQPIGTFYIGKISSEEILKITKVNRRIDHIDGIQRELSIERVNEIAAYCNDPDATFPTPIILSVTTSNTEKLVTENGLYFEYDSSSQFAEILDGQHRVDGIRKNGNTIMELVIIIMFDLTPEEKAYVFSTINSNQAKVDKSLIFDLFELSENRSPYKTCHDIARILNGDPSSPLYNRLKMLGKKIGEDSSLSQGTFVTYLVTLISRLPKEDAIKLKKGWKLKDDAKLPLRQLFINGNDEVILKILLNYFNAVRDVFYKEWTDSNNYILCKTTGFGALIKAFKIFYQNGLNNRTLTYDYFTKQFSYAKENLLADGMELTSEYFPSNEQQQLKLSKIFTRHLLNE